MDLLTKCTLLFCLYSGNCLAQTNIPEELFNEAKAIYKRDPDKAFRLLTEYEKLSAGDYSDIGKAKWMTAYIYKGLETYNLSLINNFNALEAYRVAGDSDDQISKINLDIGHIFLRSGSNELAIHYFHQSIEKSQTDKVLASNFHNLSLAYRATLSYDSGFYYSEKSLGLRQELRDWYGVNKERNELGNLHFDQGNFREALRFFREALNHLDESDHKLRALVTNNIGESYLSLEKYDSATSYLQEALRLKKEFSIHDRLAATLNQLSELALLSGDPATAISHQRRAVLIGDYSDPADLEKAYSKLVTWYELHDRDSALYFSKALNALKITEDEQIRITAGLSKKYQLELINSEFEKREEKRSRDKYIRWILTISILTITGFGLLVFSWWRMVKKRATDKDGPLLKMVSNRARFLLELLIYENEENKKTIAEYQELARVRTAHMSVSRKDLH